MARKNFCFGSGSKKFSRQNDFFLARVFAKTRAASRPFLARKNHFHLSG
nr:hypothetical protein [Porphyromonas gulae]